ncbi:multicopper oxidase family protein [bacterium]|nr:MAG: multicopper oxidase family protein [bacterium]
MGALQLRGEPPRMNRIAMIASLAATGALASVDLPYARAARRPDVVLTAQETSWEVRPGLVTRTRSYGGTVPAAPLRVREGHRMVVELRNRTRDPQTISWHGMVVPDTVDGLHTPAVAPGASGTYEFTATPAGTRLYHSVEGGGMFSGLFGPLIVDARDERGDYDREAVLLLHEFEPSIPARGSMMDERPPGSPTLSAPAMGMSGGAMGNMGGMGAMDMGGMLMYDATYAVYAVNGKALGAGDPIRVERGERVRFRIINASATLTHRLALPGHRFMVTHLDGNAVPVPHTLDAVELGPGERVDALVTMDAPGVWVFGSTVEEARRLGLGVVVAYDGARGEAVWRDEPRDAFRYADFGGRASVGHVDGVYDLVLRQSPEGHNAWSINGRRYPNTTRLYVRKGGTFLIRFSNLSMMEHPMHVLGNGFELAMVDGVATSGIRKDTVVVRPMMGRTNVLFRADNPDGGEFLLMCHNWQHMEGGMACVVAYV